MVAYVAVANHRRQRMLFSSAMEDGKKRRKKMPSGTHTSVIEERSEMKHTHSYTYADGLKSSPYVFSGIFWEEKNYNSIFQNMRIVTMFVQSSKIAMV